jgi:carboxyl-terminal processing protease
LFYGAIRNAATAGAKGVLLDLRGNPGGYLEVAVNLAGLFLPKGTIVVSEADRNGIRDRLRADGNAALADIPTVVLVDGGSASAAEILAGALRDQRQVPLVGETTFGKGSVQEYMDLEDGSVVKLTIAHWVLPKGKILNGDGIVPDHEVKLTAEDIEAERDPQLDKGAEILRGMIK